MRVLALITDAYGGYGGIAVYNRDVLDAFCSHPKIESVVALPRAIPNPLEPMPAKLDYRVGAARGAGAYLASVAGARAAAAGSDIIYCAHLNLLPLAWMLGRMSAKPVLCALYGIEAWQPTRRRIVDRLVSRIGHYFAISEVTRERFAAWSGVGRDRIALLPNAIHLDRYGINGKPHALAAKLGLQNRKVLMTLGRIVSHERAKGFDEVIGILPDLAKQVPDIAYLVVGEGDYRPELERKAQALGVRDRVVFTGYVDEAQKADFYRLADLYMMPSRGEGFGFVFLEAMACGVPVVASSADGSRDAVLNGTLGPMVDPGDRAALIAAALEGLSRPKEIPARLDYFSFANFEARLHALMDKVAA